MSVLHFVSLTQNISKPYKTQLFFTAFQGVFINVAVIFVYHGNDGPNFSPR